MQNNLVIQNKILRVVCNKDLSCGTYHRGLGRAPYWAHNHPFLFGSTLLDALIPTPWLLPRSSSGDRLIPNLSPSAPCCLPFATHKHIEHPNADII